MKKKENTRDVILETASCLFQTQGYHGTGLNQIIEESGAPKGSLYYHFPDGKEEIALEAIKLMKQHVLDLAKQDLEEKDNAIEAFQYHINNIASNYDKRAYLDGVQIGLIASETAATHEALRVTCQGAYADWQALYASILVKFHYQEDRAKELALTINALVEGACTLSVTEGSGEPLHCIARQLPILLRNEETALKADLNGGEE